MGLFGILGRISRSGPRSEDRRCAPQRPAPMPARPLLGEGWHVVDLQGLLAEPGLGFDALTEAGLSAGNPPGAKAGESPPFDPGWWEPLVVDQAIFSFQPRPNGPDVFRADTVCDGWSSRHYTVRAASVRGYEHRYRGLPRQDDVLIALHPETETVVFAVTDGRSTATRPEAAATIAGQAAVRAVLDALDRDLDPVPWDRLLRHVQRQLTEEVALLVGTIRPALDGPRVTLVQAGDAGAWLLREGRFFAVPAAAAPAPPLPSVLDAVEPVEFTLPPDAVLLVGTSGFGVPLGDGTGPVGELFASALPIPPSPIGLARMLDFSSEAHGDDRTLVAIWPSSGR